MLLSSYLVLVLAITLQVSRTTAADGERGKKFPTGMELLKKILFSDYDDEVAPNDVEVEVGVQLRCAYPSDTPENSISVNVWETMIWVDDRLTWDPKKFDDIEELHLNSYHLWHPDIQLYNSLDSNPYNYRNTWNNLILHSDGTVYWVPQATYKVFCDDNDCHFSLGSWTYSGNQMKLSLYDETGVSTDNYDDTCPLQILDPEAHIKITEYDCCPDDPYPSVEVHFTVDKADSGSGDYYDYYEYEWDSDEDYKKA